MWLTDIQTFVKKSAKLFLAGDIWPHVYIWLTVIFPVVLVVFMLELKLKSYKKLEVCLFPFPRRAAAFRHVKSAKLFLALNSIMIHFRSNITIDRNFAFYFQPK